MKMLRMRVILFLLLSSAVIGYPETRSYRTEQISADQGFFQNFVHWIFQDSTGFIWIGTRGGLYKYDGYKLSSYVHDQAEPNSLSNNKVYSFSAGEDDILWIGTMDGLNRFDVRKNSFTHYKHDPDDPNSLSSNLISCVFRERRGILWIGTFTDGLNRFDPETNEVKVYKMDSPGPAPISSNEITAICDGQDGILWVGTGDGLNKFDKKMERFTVYRNEKGSPPMFHGTYDNYVSALHLDRAGVLWLGFVNNGLDKFDPETETFTCYHFFKGKCPTFKNNTVWFIHEDRGGKFWIGTNGDGLKQFNRETGEFIDYLDTVNRIDYYMIIWIFQDRSGAFWMGTFGGGLYKSNIEGNKFSPYRIAPVTADDPEKNSIWAIFQDREDFVWLGTQVGGLYKYDLKKNEYINYRANPEDPYSISYNFVTAILEESPGKLWVGTYGGGVNLFDQTSGRFFHYKNDAREPKSLSSNFVSVLFKDRSGTLWVGTRGGGLNRFDRQENKFSPYLPWLNSPDREINSHVAAIIQDSQGFLWFGTYGNGLNRFDRENKRLINYNKKLYNPMILDHPMVRSIYEDRSGCLWAGISYGGINKFNREDETFKRYQVKDGLPDEIIQGILEDDSGNLWISTTNGLSRFDPKTEKFINFSVRNELQIHKFNLGACFKNSKGEMYFGGMNGFIRFNPGEIEGNDFIPPIVFTSIKFLDKNLVMDKNISEIEELKISYRDLPISVEFAALSYKDPGRNRYAYMIEGLSYNWIDLDNDHNLIISGLEAGEYTLRVKGSNEDGVWNEQGAAVRLVIMPPFWKTWWFKGLVTLLLFFLLFAWHRTRMKRLARRLKSKSEMEKFLIRYNISERELEVIHLILQGKSNQEIENELYIAVGTVKRHVHNIFEKLNVKSRLQLINLFKNLDSS